MLKINPVRFGVEGAIKIENAKSEIPLEKIVNVKVNNQKSLELSKQGNKWSYFYMADAKEILKIKIV